MGRPGLTTLLHSPPRPQSWGQRPDLTDTAAVTKAPEAEGQLGQPDAEVVRPDVFKATAQIHTSTS